MRISAPRFLNDWFDEWRAYLAEFLATLIFVFLASLALLSNQFYGQLGTVGIALAIGFSYSALVFASVHLSGGYLNPSVTLALWLAKRMSHVKMLTLIFAQVLASFAAASLIYLIFGESASRFLLGTPTIGVGIDLASAVVMEAFLTAALVFVVFATAVDRNGPVSFAPLALGLYVVAATLIALPISGAVFNPARAVGPAVFSKAYDTLFVWIIGPFAGSLVGLVYELVFLRRGRR